MRKLLLVLACVVATACGGDKTTAPEPASVTGAWHGSSGDVTMSMTLAQSGANVTGSGQIAAATSLAFTVSGTVAGSNVSLILSSPGFNPINYAGPLSGSTLINGVLNGSGFNNIAIPVSKQ